MKYIEMKISPDLAKRYLDTSLGNRKINERVVLTYAHSMSNGNWLKNGDAIKFDEEGHLIDGHHRLNAIIRSNTPVEMTICTGVSNDAFTTFDCNYTRTFTQVLAMKSVKYSSIVAGIVKWHQVMVSSGRLYASASNISGRKKLMNKECYDLFMRDPIGYESAAQDASALTNDVKIFPQSWVGVLLYYLSHDGGYEYAFVYRFFHELCSFEESSITPIESFRKRLLKEKLSRSKMNLPYLYALFVITWNAYAKGRDLKVIRYNESNEEYPKLILNRK